MFIIFHCVQIFFWLVGGEVPGPCSRNRVLSLELPSCTSVPALVPAEELKDIAVSVPWGGTRALPNFALLFLDCPSLVSAVPPFPGKQLLEFTIWNSGNEVYFLQTRNGGTWKEFVPRRASQGPLHFWCAKCFVRIIFAVDYFQWRGSIQLQSSVLTAIGCGACCIAPLSLTSLSIKWRR